MKKFWLGVVVAGAGIMAGLDAQAGIGTSGGQILLQETGARPAALAGAYAAFSGDTYCLDVNPAGLSTLAANDILFMHVGGFEGLSTEVLTLATPLPGLGVVAVQGLYQSQPPIDNNVPEPTVAANNTVIGVGFARPLVGNFSLGVTAKILLETLGPENYSALLLNVGTQYAVNDQLTLGLALDNLGTGVSDGGSSDSSGEASSDPLPMTLVFGGKYDLYSDVQSVLTVALDADYDFPDQNGTLRVAAEYWYRHQLALRVGYQSSQVENVKGLSVGVGFRFKAGRVGLSIDYAFLPEYWETTDYDSESIVSLGVRF